MAGGGIFAVQKKLVPSHLVGEGDRPPQSGWWRGRASVAAYRPRNG